VQKQGKQSGTRQMIGLLKLGQEYGRDRLRTAIETALATSCTDAAAVQHLLHAQELNHISCELMDVGFLDRYQRPLPVMNDYDQLLAQGGAQ
jgi:hypothetical protein